MVESSTNRVIGQIGRQAPLRSRRQPPACLLLFYLRVAKEAEEAASMYRSETIVLVSLDIMLGLFILVLALH
jgi:hypothetical protein